MYRFLISCSVVLLVSAGQTAASVTEFGEYEKLAREAIQIARINLASVKPVNSRDGFKVQTCGYLFEGNVVQSIKGDSKGKVRFFAPYWFGGPLKNQQFLVFLFRPNLKSRFVLNESLRLGLRDCPVSGQYLVIRRQAATFMAFDVGAVRKFSGEWLVYRPLYSSAGIIIADDEIEKRNMPPAVGSFGYEHIVIPWEKFLRRIQAVLKE